MKKIAILGAGRFGTSLVTHLTRLGIDVLVLDHDEAKINAMDDSVAQAVCVDITNEAALSRLHLKDADIAVVCLGDNVEGSLLATVILQRLGVKEVWVRAVNEVQTHILEALKVSRILSIEDEMGRQIAHNLANPGMNLYMSITPEHNMVEIAAKKPFIGKTLGEVDFRNRYGINVVAIKNTATEKAEDGTERTVSVVNDLPGADNVIQPDDVLILIGNAESLEQIQRL